LAISSVIATRTSLAFSAPTASSTGPFEARLAIDAAIASRGSRLSIRSADRPSRLCRIPDIKRSTQAHSNETANLEPPAHPTISIADGQFVPGQTGSEIGIHVDLTGDESITLIGSDGPDVINMRPEGATLLPGSNAFDYQVRYPLTTATGRILGGEDDDYLNIDMAASFIHVGPGDDVLHAGNYWPSTYEGGAGTDFISYGLSNSITVHATCGQDAKVTRQINTDDTVVGIETLKGSTANDTFFGSSDADHFLGSGGTTGSCRCRETTWSTAARAMTRCRRGRAHLEWPST
jgi:Ca2+-binding RTX toxin-like protein